MKEIASLPWSAVITSRTEAHFASFFQKSGRSVVQQYAQIADGELDSKCIHLSRTHLPILQLFGYPAGLQEDPEDADELYNWYCAWKALEQIPGLMDKTHPLVLAGLDSEMDWHLMRRLSRLLWRHAPEGSASIWGVSSTAWTQHQKMYAALQQCGVQCCESSLHEILCTSAVQALTAAAGEDLPDGCLHGDLYYQARQPVFLSQRDLLAFRNVGFLLTERRVHHPRPWGTEEQQGLFLDFLRRKCSAGDAAWYGYTRSAVFHVQRTFEEPLYQLICRQLHGLDCNRLPERSSLIVLSGPPCSSKSITLSAVAYRIFRQHLCPILFLSETFFDFLEADLPYLDTALQVLEHSTAADAPMLLILDCSMDRFHTKWVQRLFDHLVQRGKRFVLVCSSREPYGDVNGTWCHYCAEDNAFLPAVLQDGQVLCLDDRYVIPARQDLDESEQAQFWAICCTCSGLSDAVLAVLRDKLQRDGVKEVDLFYRKLRALLRTMRCENDLYGSLDECIASA